MPVIIHSHYFSSLPPFHLALYDQAMIRFKPGHKLRDRFYARQDGTFSYYFTTQFVGELFNTEDFNCLENNYIYKRVVNRKLQANMDRLFVQARFEKK